MSERLTTPEEEILICPGCAQPIAPREHFCRHCNAPLTSFASTDPLARIRTEAEVVRRAFQHPRLIGLVGVWLIFGPSTIAAVVYGVTALRAMLPLRSISEGAIFTTYAVMTTAPACLFVAILWRMTYRYLWPDPQGDTETTIDDDPFDGEWRI